MQSAVFRAGFLALTSPDPHRPRATRTMEHNTATDTAALLAEIDTAMAAYTASIDRGLALAAEMRQMADTIDGGMADARAEFDEWW